METIGPYRLTEMLSLRPAGRVWRAVDSQGTVVTIACLETSDADRDMRFRAAAAGPLQGQVVNADLDGPRPWVALLEDSGPGALQLFAHMTGPLPTPPQANHAPPLPEGVSPATIAPGHDPAAWGPPGMPLPRPTPPSYGPAAGETAQQGVHDQGPPPPFSAPPASGMPYSGAPHQYSAPPASGMPYSGAPHQYSAPPASGAPHSAPPDQYGAGPVPSGMPYSGPPGYGPAAPAWSQQYTPVPTPPKRRRGLIVGLVALVVVITGANAAIWLMTRSDGSANPTPTSTAGQGPPESEHAGAEPPVAGKWPKAWPKFGPADKVTDVADPSGLGFSFKIPAEWACTKIDQAGTYVKWDCADKDGDGTAPGGEITVRECTKPCDTQRKTQLRRAEHAWDLQWIRVSRNSFYAESVEVPGETGDPQYGLVAVRYWNSRDGGPLDRQVVFRMAGPVNSKGTIQKVMNEVKAATA